MARFTPTEPPRVRETRLPGLPARELLAAASAAIPRKATISGWKTRSSRNPGTPQYPVPGTWADGSWFEGRSDKAGFRLGHLQELQNHIWDSTQQHLGHWGVNNAIRSLPEPYKENCPESIPLPAIGIPKYHQVATPPVCISRTCGKLSEFTRFGRFPSQAGASPPLTVKYAL